MGHAYLFEIGCKPGITDPVGRGLKQDIDHLGLGRVKNVSSAQLYRVSGQLSADEKNRIVKDLLCDPILNESRDPSPGLRHPLPKGRGPTTLAFSLQGEGGRRPDEGSRRAMVIDVWYKTGVTDVVGDSVRKGIRDLNIHGVQDVRTGMRYHLEGVTRRDVAEKIALALLVNPLVHDSIISAPADPPKRSGGHAD